jgi:ribosome-binding factor A
VAAGKSRAMGIIPEFRFVYDYRVLHALNLSRATPGCQNSIGCACILDGNRRSAQP